MSDIEFGLLIKRLREQQGMTQEELAHKIGYKSKTSINKIEMGLQDMPRPKIIAIAEALQTTPAALLGWEDAEGLDATRKELHAIIDKLPADRLEKILRVVQAIEE